MAWIGILLGSAAVVLIAGLIAGSRARRLRSVPPATATAPALPEPTHFPLWTGDQDAMADGCGLPWSSRWAPVGVCRPAVAGAPRITHRPPGDVSGGCTAGHSRCPGCPRTAVSVPAGSPQTRTRRAAGTVPVEVTTAAATAGTSPSPVPPGQQRPTQRSSSPPATAVRPYLAGSWLLVWAVCLLPAQGCRASGDLKRLWADLMRYPGQPKGRPGVRASEGTGISGVHGFLPRHVLVHGQESAVSVPLRVEITACRCPDACLESGVDRREQGCPVGAAEPGAGIPTGRGLVRAVVSRGDVVESGAPAVEQRLDLAEPPAC